MDRIPVVSSHVSEIGYDPDAMVLEVLFNNGDVYQYFDVPESLYQELMAADSQGTFLHKHVYDFYRYIKL